MSREIDVFSDNQGGIPREGADYRIDVRWGKTYIEEEWLYNLTMNVNKALQANHYVALMRYKIRAHNGSKSDGRHIYNKWFAFYYSGENSWGHNYSNASMLVALPKNYNEQGQKEMPATSGYYSYDLEGVLENGNRVDFRYALLERFAEYDDDNDVLRVFLEGKRREVVFIDPADIISDGYVFSRKTDWMHAFYNCGIGIVDIHGTLLSNIVPLKVLVRTLTWESSSDFFPLDISSKQDIAQHMVIYPQCKQRNGLTEQ